MKINAQITLLFNQDGLSLRVYDDDAAITFIELNLNQEQTCQALSRLSHTHVANAKVMDLDKVGKKMLMDAISFELPGIKSYSKNRKEIAAIAGQQYLDSTGQKANGWVLSNSFNSQGSFTYKGETVIAHATIRKWVDKENN